MEDVREMSMWIWWERLAQDLRYGLRGFRRTPAFAATAVLSLALGIGANTAIFSIFNTLVLRPLPVRDPATLFQVVHSGDGGVVRELDIRALRTCEDPREDDRGRVPGRSDVDHASAWSTVKPMRSSGSRSPVTTSTCLGSGRSSGA